MNERERERVERERVAETEREKARPPPVTFLTAYSYDNHGRSSRVPQVSFFSFCELDVVADDYMQNLYFYTLRARLSRKVGCRCSLKTLGV